MKKPFSKRHCFACILLMSFAVFSQNIEHIKAPENIKSIQLKPTKVNSYAPIIKLGEAIELSFDDLDGDEKNYTYTIIHCDYDWQQSRIVPTEYLNGLSSDNIRNYNNAFNTYQSYTHYQLGIPNERLSIKLSGNYILQVKDDLDALIFTRRFVVYEPQVTVGVSVHKSPVIEKFNTHQNVQFTVNTGTFKINNPREEIKIKIYQNNDWHTEFSNLVPQFYSGSQLIYKYGDKSLFEAGNEYLFFDTKDIRSATNNIQRVNVAQVYNTYLYADVDRHNKPYTYYPDVNGNFVIRMIDNATAITEADYSWVHFSLALPYNKDKQIYVYGNFNDWRLSDNNEMHFNKSTHYYEAKILLKQGFYNYKYIVKASDKTALNAISGNYYQTENSYTVLVYFTAFGSRYDRVIGRGVANSKNLQN
ncbi:MAG: DUF5103 domain-containing protein [Flavobacteriales bacterium]|jgi:hypothetical protein|nr:DUF5103 domain-containing protein [Flavobacteriales bacterium]